LRPDRSQLSWDLVDLEALLPADHRARIVWRFVEGMDLEPFYAAIASREGEAGRPAADPAVLMARRWKGWARRGSWIGWWSGTSPTAGWLAGFR